ncbi:recombinase XerD [Streptomyces violaceusniger]
MSHEKVRRYYEPILGVPLDALAALAYVQRPGAVKEGTPFFLGAGMRPAEPLCSFFLELAKTVKAKSMQDYAYDAMDVVDFLAELDPPADLLSATEDDLLAYREDCTELRESPDMPATWKRRRVTINSFYDWATDPKTKLLEERPYYRRSNGRDVLSWGATSELDVRHLTFRQWRFLKQVGLRGLLPNDRVDPAFRGQSPLRNSAGGELAITTGMRLQEFSCLFDIEVPAPRRDGSPAEVPLQAIAKFGIPRVVAVQDATLGEIDMYRRTERAAMVRASARALARRREELFVVSDIDLRRRKLTGMLDGRRRTFRIEAIPAATRRRAVFEGDQGLEPMALFVGRGGRMPTKTRWEQIFEDAHVRSLQVSEEYACDVVMPQQLKIHDSRHTFAIYMLQMLTLLVMREEAERLREGGHGAFLADHISRNPLLILQGLLGHRSPKSTMRYLRYIRNTNALVNKAIEEWNNQDKTYVDYASALVDKEIG